MNLDTVARDIKPIDKNVVKLAQKHYDSLIKPVGSLGKLEKMISLYAGAVGHYNPQELVYPKRAIIFWLDNNEFKLTGKTPVEVLVEDIKGEVVLEEFTDSKMDVIFAMNFGKMETEKLIADGFGLICPTTKGRYIIPSGWERLKQQTPLEILETLGSPICAMMVGSILTCAKNKVMIMLDGLSSLMAAFIAIKINPNVKDYCIASSFTTERGVGDMLKDLDMSPVLKLHITEGSGYGAALGIGLFDAGLKAYKEMETFAEAGVHDEMEEFSQAKVDKKGKN